MENYRDKKALIVEDDAVYAKIEEQTLVRFGFTRENVKICSSIADMTKIQATGFKPELIILDLNIDDSKGIDTFVDTRNIFPYEHIIILSSLNKTDVDLLAISENETVDFIEKDELNTISLSKAISRQIAKKELTLPFEDEEMYKIFFTHDQRAMCIIEVENWTLLKANNALLNLLNIDLYGLLGMRFSDLGMITSNEIPLFNHIEKTTFTIENRLLKFKNLNEKIIDLEFRRLNHSEKSFFIITFIDKSHIKQDAEDAYRMLMISKEMDKNKIANDLHETVTPLISSSITTLKTGHKSDPIIREELHNSVIQNLSMALQICLDLSYELAAPPIQDGLLNSIYIEFERLSSYTDIQFTLLTDLDVNDPFLQQFDTFSIFKIISEFNENTIQHSQGQNAICEIQRLNNELVLTLSDDGIGFNTMNTKKGIGLKEIDNMIKLMNADLLFHSFPGKGTSLKVKIKPNQRIHLPDFNSFLRV